MIAGSYPTELRIVRTWPGPQTGDSYYETEDGRVWITRPSYGPELTGVTYGSVIGDRMVSPPRSTGVPFYPRAPIIFDRPKPMPAPEEVTKPPRPVRRPKARLAPPVSFVGAGPMHRRWR